MKELSLAARKSKAQIVRMLYRRAEDVWVSVEVEPTVHGMSILDERVQIHVTLPSEGYGFTVTILRYATGGVDILFSFGFDPGAAATTEGRDLRLYTVGIAHWVVALSGLEPGLSEADRALIQQHEDSAPQRLRDSFAAYKKRKEEAATDGE